MRTGTILATAGVFGLMVTLFWRTVATDGGGQASDGQAVVPPTRGGHDVAN